MTTAYSAIFADPDQETFRLVGMLLFPGTAPGGTIDVTDGTTTVTSVSTIDFTTGAVVTDGGGGTADVSISGQIDGGSSVSTYLASQVINGGSA